MFVIDANVAQNACPAGGGPWAPLIRFGQIIKAQRLCLFFVQRRGHAFEKRIWKLLQQRLSRAHLCQSFRCKRDLVKGFTFAVGVIVSGYIRRCRKTAPRAYKVFGQPFLESIDILDAQQQMSRLAAVHQPHADQRLNIAPFSHRRSPLKAVSAEDQAPQRRSGQTPRHAVLHSQSHSPR